MAKRPDSAEAAKTEDTTPSPNIGDAPAPEKTAAPPKLAAKLVYLGPSIAEGGMLYPHGQIFSNGLPIKWLEKAGNDPDFRLLLVPFGKVPKARKELSDPQSMLSMVCNRVVEKHAATTKEAK